MSFPSEWDVLQGDGSSVYDELAYLQQESALKPTLDDFAVPNHQLDSLADSLLGASPAAESDHTVHVSPHQLYANASYSSPVYGASLDSAVSYSAPSARSLSFEGGAPSPLPALSPPRSGTSFSSPTSSASSYGGVVSPRQLPPQRQLSSHGILLPPADVYSLAPSGLSAPPPRPNFARRGSSAGDGPSWFADAQEQYLTQQFQPQAYQPHQHQAMYQPPYSADFAQHRSPHRTSFSTPGQPHMSPYSRLAGQAAMDRRGSTGNLRYDAMARSGASKDPRTSPVRRASLIAMGDATPPRPSAVKRRGSRLSIAVPPPTNDLPQSSPLEQSQSSEEIDQILQMVDMMSSFDNSPQGQAMQHQESTSSSQGHSRYTHQRPPPLQINTSQGSGSSAPYSGTIEVSGVTLGAEDLEMLVSPDPNQFHDGSHAERAYPASAPAWQTTFTHGPPPPIPNFSPGSHGNYPTSPVYPSAQYTAYPPPPHSAGLAPPAGFAPSRPRSAEPASGLAPPVLLRRGSSLRESTSASPTPVAAAAAAPEPAAVPVPAPAKAPARTPKKGVGKKAKKDAGGIGGMFVNYGASDAKKLLSGVAPSGSSKRKREEEEAARLAALEGREVPQSGEVAA